MSAKFVSEEGEMAGVTLSLKDGEQWVIGRDPDSCQVLLEDPSTSRKHLVCRTSPEGIILENLSDTNPVLVNEEAVEEPRLLKDGDTVTIGKGLFHFYAEENINTEESIFDDEEPTHETIYEESSDEDKGILAEIDFDLRETGRWLLKVIGGPNNGAEFSMQTDTSYIIGTDPNACDVVFHDTSVSRQHAKITVDSSDVLIVEDLRSRNGTIIDGEPIKGKRPLEPNTLVTTGTTSFLVFDREGDMQTIISPLMPSIVKVLQKGEEQEEKSETIEVAESIAVEKPKEKKENSLGAFILIGIITTLFAVVAIGTTALFQTESVQPKEKVNIVSELDKALSLFPSVTYSYNTNTGGLLLVGHVLTSSDKNQLIYSLQSIKNAKLLKILDDSGLVVDEYIWRETNKILARDPRWKGINIHSPVAGTFILSGYLRSRKQAEELYDYMTANFPYLDLLERRIIVEEDVISTVERDLEKAKIKNIDVQMSNGELTLTGGIGKGQTEKIDRLIRSFREISGVRTVKTFIDKMEIEQTIVNVTNRYQVTGFSHQGGVNLNVVIDGRILSRGDVLDGMVITSIETSAILLEKDGVKYKIDYN